MAAARLRRKANAVSNDEAELSTERHWLPQILHECSRIAPLLAHPETYHHRIDVTRARQRLEEERTETFECELELTNLTILEGELRDIHDALQRLDAGTYGSCEACGKPIDEGRLEAKPSARFRIVDQVHAEHALSRH